MKWMEWGGVQRTQFRGGEKKKKKEASHDAAVNEAFLDVGVQRDECREDKKVPK